MYQLKKTFSVLLVSIITISSCNLSQPKNEDVVKIKSDNSKVQGYGINVVAEIENISDKKLSMVLADFTWYDKNGKIIDSGTGSCRDIDPHGTAIIDRYFDEMPKGSTYKIKISKIAY